MQITIAEVRDAVRADAISLMLGALLVIVGTLAGSLSAVARRRKAPTLSLGLFAFLYGLRLLTRTDIFRVGVGQSEAFWEHLDAAITYVVPIPLLLFARTLEPAWNRVWNPTLAGMSIFAVCAIAADQIAGVPHSARTLNNLIAIGLIVALLATFFRPGLPPTHELRSWRLGIASVSLGALVDNLRGMRGDFAGPDLEPFGFTIAIACFGTVLGRRVLSDARRLASLDNELGIARDIQASILPQSMPRIDGLRIAAVYRPMTSVAGDFYDFLEAGGNRLGVLVADVSGHGVPAALIASMVKVALAAQQAAADRPADVLAGINRVLFGRLGGQYVTAAYLFVDVDAGIMRYAAAGHPPMLRGRGRAATSVDAIEQNGLLLGFIEDAAYQAREEPIPIGDRLLLYTDGLFEAENDKGEDYGLDRVSASLAGTAALPAAGAAEAMVAAMNALSNRPALDDLTLVLVDRIDPRPGPA